MFLCSLIEELCTKEENDKTGCNFNFGHECSFSQTIPEVFKCFQLLRYLPVEFDMIVQGILWWSEQEFTFEKILTELIDEESRITLLELDRKDK